MDPISQGVLGAAFAQSFAKKPQIRKAAVIGWLGGMLADADVLISSSTDPLFGLSYHRHFTHSLIFTPIGGLITACLLWFFYKKNTSFKTLFWFGFLGYVTHALLDSCTSYGTHLLWPFSDRRESWRVVGIIDPMVTGPLLIGLFFALFKQKRIFAQGALVFVLLYLGFGWSQRNQAEDFLQKHIAKQGHQAVNYQARPTALNLFLWRLLYHTEDQIYAHALLLKPWQDPIFYKGEAIKKVSVQKDFSHLPADSVLVNDIKRFQKFSFDYLGFDPNQKNTLGDMRYSSLPNSFDSLWGIDIDENQANRHVEFRYYQDFSKKNRETFVRMLKGKVLED